MRQAAAASCLFALSLLISSSIAVSQNRPVDWEKEKAEILKHYRALVQIETTYSNETKVVEYLKKVLDAEGIPSKTFAVDPTRANLVARLKGNGATPTADPCAYRRGCGAERKMAGGSVRRCDEG